MSNAHPRRGRWVPPHTPQVQRDRNAEPFRFLDLPRECRDKVYRQLFVRPFLSEEHETYARIMSGDFAATEDDPMTTLERLELQLAILPNAPGTKRFLQGGRNLLLANKQVHEEASECLFGENVFGVVINGRHRQNIWRTTQDEVFESDSGRFISCKDFRRIKHLAIIIENKTSLEDPAIVKDTRVSQQDLEALVDILMSCGNKLRYLRVHSVSCFARVLEDYRDALDSPATGPVCPVMMIDWCTQKPWAFTREQIDRLFKNTYILNSLAALKGRVDDICITGDIRISYIYQLELAICGTKAVVKSMQRKRREALRNSKEYARYSASRRRMQRPSTREESASFAPIIRSLAESNWEDQELADLANDMERTSFWNLQCLEREEDGDMADQALRASFRDQELRDRHQHGVWT